MLHSLLYLLCLLFTIDLSQRRFGVAHAISSKSRPQIVEQETGLYLDQEKKDVLDRYVDSSANDIFGDVAVGKNSEDLKIMGIKRNDVEKDLVGNNVIGMMSKDDLAKTLEKDVDLEVNLRRDNIVDKDVEENPMKIILDLNFSGNDIVSLVDNSISNEMYEYTTLKSVDISNPKNELCSNDSLLQDNHNASVIELQDGSSESNIENNNLNNIEIDITNEGEDLEDIGILGLQKNNGSRNDEGKANKLISETVNLKVEIEKSFNNLLSADLLIEEPVVHEGSISKLIGETTFNTAEENAKTDKMITSDAHENDIKSVKYGGSGCAGDLKIKERRTEENMEITRTGKKEGTASSDSRNDDQKVVMTDEMRLKNEAMMNEVVTFKPILKESKRTASSRKNSWLQLGQHYKKDSPQNLALQNLLLIRTSAQCFLPQKQCISVNKYRRAYWPNCALLHQCGGFSGCCDNPAEVCRPVMSEVDVVKIYFFKLGGANAVEALWFINHTRCECGPPLKVLHYNTSPPKLPERECHCPKGFYTMEPGNLSSEAGCMCDCQPRKHKSCKKIKRGRRSYSSRGCKKKCSPPKCDYGDFKKDFGRCPRRSEKHGKKKKK